MAKGKAKKGKKKAVVQDPNALTEVDKTFYELTIADLNRKLARLRSLTQELEEKNEELIQEKEKLDEDRADIITYLKRMLQEKTNEINELEERITALQEVRQNETEKFEAKVAELEQEYKTMHEQLTSENKLLEGKLNSLEEFRSQRDELMKKFESQEKKMETQAKNHAREMYEIERKFIISKDKLKKDMEARLMQLSSEFHDASELRIAATTHRVIRENIAVNNELDSMLSTQQKLFRDNHVLKNRDTALRQDAELHEKEKKIALSKVGIQQKVIDKITAHNKHLKKDLEQYKKFELEVRESRNLIKEAENCNRNLEFKLKLLEQNLHRIKCDNSSLKTEVLYLKAENERLDDILIEGLSCIKECLTIKTSSDESIKSSKRESLINSLFNLLSKGHERKVKRPSLETISSADATYALGDLGFVPKHVPIRPTATTRRNIQSQTGISFDEYLEFGEDKVYTIKSYADRSDSSLDMSSEQDYETLEPEEVMEEEEKRSVLFYSSTEVEEEETEDGSKDFDPFATVESYEELINEESRKSILSDKKARQSQMISVEEMLRSSMSDTGKKKVKLETAPKEEDLDTTEKFKEHQAEKVNVSVDEKGTVSETTDAGAVNEAKEDKEAVEDSKQVEEQGPH